MSVNDELIRIWKEVVVSCFKVLSRNFHEEIGKLRKLSVRIVGILPRFGPDTSRILVRSDTA
jgi:hypothetical protein